MLGEIVSSVGSIAGSLLQSGHQKRRDERQFRHAREMAEYAYSKDLEMWQRQNEYNAPIQQMQRLKDAGLNPHLVYGQGVAGATGQAKEMPKYQAPRPNYTYGSPFGAAQLTMAMGNWMSFQKHNAEMDILSEELKIRKAEAEQAPDYYWGRQAGQHVRNNYANFKYAVESGSGEWQDHAGRFNKVEYAPYWMKRKLENEQLTERNTYMSKRNRYFLEGLLGNNALGTAIKAGTYGRAKLKGISDRFTRRNAFTID